MKNYLGLDVGSKTVGLAISSGYLASPYQTLRFAENDFALASAQLVKIIKNEEISDLIVGYPKNMDNSVGHRVMMVDDFVKTLIATSGYPDNVAIHYIDERLTTRYANQIMLTADLSRKKRKEHKDGLAAQIILETFLQQQAQKQ